MRTVGAIGAWGLLAATPCAAEVVAAEPGGFALEAARDVAATPAAVWATLLAPARWWDGAHTYSGAATNLSLRAEPGGCFCERLPAGGAVEHARVLFLRPRDTLRLSGALGPLQSEALAGTLTFTLAPTASGRTRVTMRYVVGGFMPGGVATLAPVVDRVMTTQLTRLAAAAAR